MAPGSDMANLSVMGYDPNIYYTGRSPLEALSIGVDMEQTDVSFRCNLVTLTEEGALMRIRRSSITVPVRSVPKMRESVLLDALREGLKKEGYEFLRGTSYRHLLIWKQGKVLDLTAPHDILTKTVGEYLPRIRFSVR